MITEKTYKALKILAARTNWNTPIMAKEFAWLLWGDEPDKRYLFEAHTNTGNGACAGKKHGFALEACWESCPGKVW